MKCSLSTFEVRYSPILKNESLGKSKYCTIQLMERVGINTGCMNPPASYVNPKTIHA